MSVIKSFDLDRWSEPDENRRVKHIGMADSKETFERLKKHLETEGLLPDEYFLHDHSIYGMTEELPDYYEALCIPNFGDSEGIYLDISLAYMKDNERCFYPFATGKTLEESADAYFKMFRIAAECSLMLNGRGREYPRDNTDLTMTPDEIHVMNKLVQDALQNPEYHNEENSHALETLAQKFSQDAVAVEHILMRHGADDFVLWTVALSHGDLEQLRKDGVDGSQGDLETLLHAMPTEDGSQGRVQILTRLADGPYGLCTCKAPDEFWTAHQNDGCSVRGSMADIMQAIHANFQQPEQAEADDLER